MGLHFNAQHDAEWKIGRIWRCRKKTSIKKPLGHCIYRGATQHSYPNYTSCLLGGKSGRDKPLQRLCFIVKKIVFYNPCEHDSEQIHDKKLFDNLAASSLMAFCFYSFHENMLFGTFFITACNHLIL